MKLSLITPAGRQSRSGNRKTANRWARILRDLGHRVRIDEAYEPHQTDAMVAIHAWRSAACIQAFRARHPNRPLVVLLAGTDIYRFQYSHPVDTLASMEAADCLIGLHEGVAGDIPARFADKLKIVFQSAQPLASPRVPSHRHFDVCVVGHLREEKDSLRAAIAARSAPGTSKLRVLALGKAHSEDWHTAATAEMQRNARFQWRGEVAPGAVRQCFGRCHAMVISSVMEGGANVVSEAVAAGLPVIASDISGNVGLLGPAHPAYFPVKDDAALAHLLHLAEFDPDFLASIDATQRERVQLFEPARERAAWQSILEQLNA